MSKRLFPELDKLAAKSSELETIEGFVEFMREKGVQFGCWENNTFEACPIKLSEFIYEYLGIDMSDVENERRKILEQLQ
ncbi:hypothetical protein KUL150_09980 [Alteromonas sp. KUL150]|uniref:hypothetical protein n=1 Tax=Alteromonas sp. KUL150 TaxID=2480805 RepID=UPI0012E56DB5|nr:hypothetical protein [Alteromonas sp. KUL150]GFD84939.1 hypothetical protein KUL150_09980 [Alteromonas sp. KUL150]